MLIDTKLIYLWGISDNVIAACGAVAFLAIIAGVVVKGICAAEGEKSPKWTTILLIVGAVCGLVAMLMPNRETLLTIQVAKLITKDNIEWTVDQVKELVDYIIATVNAVGGAK